VVSGPGLSRETVRAAWLDVHVFAVSFSFKAVFLNSCFLIKISFFYMTIFLLFIAFILLSRLRN